jgi:hypothetical protein
MIYSTRLDWLCWLTTAEPKRRLRFGRGLVAQVFLKALTDTICPKKQ